MANTMNETVLNASPHIGQAEVHNSNARFKVLSAGRRWGKTRLGVMECMQAAFEGGRSWWVAPSYKLAAVGWRSISRIGASMPGAEVKQGERLVSFANGGSVQVRSADDPDSRSWSEAIRPALSDKKGAALMISTPSGQNWFWRMYQRGNSQDNWASFSYPTSSNPYIDDAEIEAARNDLPEMIFQQEYEAKFMEHGAGVFRKVMAAVNGDTAPTTGSYVIGCDWGRQKDATVYTVLNVDSGHVVEIDRMVKVDYQTQVSRLQALWERYPGAEIISELNSMGAPITESLQNSGLPVTGFNTTVQSKQQIIDGLALGFERGDLHIPRDPILIGELQAYESKRLPSGRTSYSAPDGMHDDCVMSLALAWSGRESAEPIVLLSI
jgi:hypothetical protein